MEKNFTVSITEFKNYGDDYTMYPPEYYRGLTLKDATDLMNQRAREIENEHGMFRHVLTPMSVELCDSPVYKDSTHDFLIKILVDNVQTLIDEMTIAWWCNNPEYNFLYLKQMQELFNLSLHAYKFVSLAEVYDQLGISMTDEQRKENKRIGWKLSKDGGDDGYIDFGLIEAYKLMKGNNSYIVLEFNVDNALY